MENMSCELTGYEVVAGEIEMNVFMKELLTDNYLLTLLGHQFVNLYVHDFPVEEIRSYI